MVTQAAEKVYWKKKKDILNSPVPKKFSVPMKVVLDLSELGFVSPPKAKAKPTQKKATAAPQASKRIRMATKV